MIPWFSIWFQVQIRLCLTVFCTPLHYYCNYIQGLNLTFPVRQNMSVFPKDNLYWATGGGEDCPGKGFGYSIWRIRGLCESYNHQSQRGPGHTGRCLLNWQPGESTSWHLGTKGWNVWTFLLLQLLVWKQACHHVNPNIGIGGW